MNTASLNIMRPRCRRCVRCTPAVTTVDRVPMCRTCAKVATSEPKDLAIAPVATREIGARQLVRAFLVALLLSLGAAHAEEAPAAPVESRYCARDGESIDQRIERLEVAIRLAKAERAVNTQKRRRPAARP